jgi:hypothetical protein
MVVAHAEPKSNGGAARNCSDPLGGGARASECWTPGAPSCRSPVFFLRLEAALWVYLEMRPAKLHVHDMHEEFSDCTDESGRAVSPAVSELMSDGQAPTATVAEITNKVLELLQAGELAPAQRYAQEWLAKGASSDGLDATAQKRWEMTRELLAAAWEIPLPITKALAKGIDGNNPATAADACKEFAKSNPDGAAAADKVLAAKAPGLNVYIPGALSKPAAPKQAAPQQPRFQYYAPEPVYYSSSSSSSTTWPIWAVVGVIVVAFIRCAAVSSRTSSYSNDYDFDYQPPSYNYDNSWNDDKYKDLQKALDDIEKNKDLYGSDSYTGNGNVGGYDDYKPAPSGPPEVPEFYADSDTEEYYSDISASLSALYRVDMTSDKQQQYLEKLDDAVVDRDCAKMKKYIGQLMYSKPGEELDYATLAKDHMKAIKKRVDIVCKKAVKKAAAPKPADTTGIEDPF